MYRYLLLLGCVFTSGVKADDSWVSIPTSPVTPKVMAASDDISDISQVKGSQSTASSDLTSELLVQLDQMQQELSLLRNLVEQNSQSINRSIETEQQRYLEVDRRLSTLTKELLMGQSYGEPSPVTESQNQIPEAKNPDANVVTEAAITATAEDAYQQAMALLRDKDFNAARQSFRQFRQNYKEHPLVANALYWQAEVLLIEQELVDAASLFQQVVEQFPRHGKAADAAYKLGVTLHRQGNLDAAKKQLQQVVKKYSDSAASTVKLAESYLQKL